MEKYKLKDFTKWAKAAGVSDMKFAITIDEMNKGLLGDRLGSNRW